MATSVQPTAAQSLLIFGATGLIGTHITKALVDGKTNFQDISIFTSPGARDRKPQIFQHLEDQGVKVIIGDIESEQNVRNAYQGIDTVVSCLGRNVIANQVMLVRLAAESDSVKWFFPSEYGTDIEYGPESAHEKPHQNKIKVRAAMAEVKNDLEYTYVVTGPYGDGDPGLYLSANPNARKSGSFDVKNKTAVLHGDGKLQIGLTTMKDVGKLVLAALLHPTEAKNKALKVNSFYTTDQDLLAEFERQTGGERWQVSYTSIEELKEMENEAWATNKPWATGVTLRRIWASGGTLYERLDNELIGAKDNMTSLSEAVADAIKVQMTDN